VALRQKFRCIATFFRYSWAEYRRAAVTIVRSPTPIAERVADRTAEKVFHKIWPAAVAAVVVTGFLLTAAWTCLLGYGITEFIF
jgi:hypothetical protein